MAALGSPQNLVNQALAVTTTGASTAVPTPGQFTEWEVWSRVSAMGGAGNVSVILRITWAGGTVDIITNAHVGAGILRTQLANRAIPDGSTAAIIVTEDSGGGADPTVAFQLLAWRRD